MDPIKTLYSRVPGLVAHIYQDPHPHYDFDTLGTITYAAGARTVVGVVPKTAEEDAEIARKVRDGEYIGLPVWAYVHSDATVHAAFESPFSCPWDSGRSGWVYVERDKALKEYGRKVCTRKFKYMIETLLMSEVETFNMYLTGDVWGYEIVHDDEQIEACWNYFGIKGLEEEVQSILDVHAQRASPMTQLELPIQFA